MDRRVVLLISSSALLVSLGSSCGSTSTDGAIGSAGSSSGIEVTTTGLSTSFVTDDRAVVTSAVDDLPGTPVQDDEVSDLHLPRAGGTLTVTGVEDGDTLNVRAGPGVYQQVVATLDPTEGAITASGRHRRLDDSSIWSEIGARGTTGWANWVYLAFHGPTFDLTSDAVTRSGGYPEASTMLELGAIVADLYTNEATEVYVSMAPTDGDLGEVIYDVTGIGDDSIMGLRLHVFGVAKESGSGYTLTSLESTDLCWRGGSPDGLCV